MRCENIDSVKHMVFRSVVIEQVFSVCFFVAIYVVIFDSALLGELFYHQFMEEQPTHHEKRRNIHQQLEDKPDEFSQDSDSDQSMVYNFDPAPTSPFASFYVDIVGRSDE